MTKEIEEIKSKISEIKLLLDMSYYCQKKDNKKKLLEELDRLSYLVYKSAVAQMRSLEGDGDGI